MGVLLDELLQRLGWPQAAAEVFPSRRTCPSLISERSGQRGFRDVALD